jgi:hypothetical protein
MHPDPPPARPSDEAVARATGRDWATWFAALDDEGAHDLDHPVLVRLLDERFELASGWWQQTVAVAWEQHVGRRRPGQVADGTWQLGVRRTVPVPRATAWHLVRDRLLDSDEHFEVRSERVNQRLRLRCEGPVLPAGSTLQVTLSEAARGTTIGVHHEGIPDEQRRNELRDAWRRRLEQLRGDIAAGG